MNVGGRNLPHIREQTMTAALPAFLARLVTDFIEAKGLDVTSADAMTGACYDVSRALEVALEGQEDDDGEEVFATAVQVWMDGDPLPEPLAANEMAPGHWIVRAEYDCEKWEIDLTAAQFPEIGWTGPRFECVG